MLAEARVSIVDGVINTGASDVPFPVDELKSVTFSSLLPVPELIIKLPRMPSKVPRIGMPDWKLEGCGISKIVAFEAVDEMMVWSFPPPVFTL